MVPALVCPAGQTTTTRYRTSADNGWLYRVPLLAALAYAETEAFKEEMKLRPQVERLIAILVLYNGARRARFMRLSPAAVVPHQAHTLHLKERRVSTVDVN
jgi:hypothetical protein